MNLDIKDAKGKAARRLPDGAKEILQDFVVAVLRSKIPKERFPKFAADWFQRLVDEEDRKKSDIPPSVLDVPIVTVNEPAPSENEPQEDVESPLERLASIAKSTTEPESPLASLPEVKAPPPANLEPAPVETLAVQPSAPEQATKAPASKFLVLPAPPPVEEPAPVPPPPEPQSAPPPEAPPAEPELAAPEPVVSSPQPEALPPAKPEVLPPRAEASPPQADALPAQLDDSPAEPGVPSSQPASDEHRGPTGRRQGISAETYDPSAPSTESEIIKSFPKTEEQLAHVKDVVRDVLIFRTLDEEHLLKVIDALEEIQVEVGQDVITQGEEKADYFYIVQNGEFDCFMTKNGQPAKMAEYINKGSFGELALMYSQPRAATVKARSAGQLWRLDRETFKRIVIGGANEKRQLYMSLLEKVDFIADLQSYEKQNVCDALTGKTYSAGEDVMRQGEAGDGMYFVEAGEVVCMRTEEGDDKEIGRAGPGEYVGELALITSQPRAATVTAAVDGTKLAFLDAKAFERLMGPCVDILKKNRDKYRDKMVAAFGENYSTFLH